jgi:alkyl hydroperoxide reductase subunit AhpC
MLSTLIGNPAPRFDLPCTRFPDPSRTRVGLEDYRGRWLLLLFYPRDFSLICPTELIGVSQHFEEFEKRHCEILGIGCDPVDLHERWMATPMDRGGLGGLNFPTFLWLATSTGRSRRSMAFTRRVSGSPCAGSFSSIPRDSCSTRSCTI